MLSPFNAKKSCRLVFPKFLVSNEVLKSHFLHMRYSVCVCALTFWGEIEEENMFGKGSIGHKYKKIKNKIKDKVSNLKKLPIFRES